MVKGDSLDEADESVLVSLRNATNATITGTGAGAGVIQDDDPLPTVSPGWGFVTEGDAGNAVLTVPVSLSAASGRSVSFDWRTVESDALAGVDYVTASGTVTFLPGERNKTIQVTVSGDVLDEPDETFLIGTSNVTNAKIGGIFGFGLATIQDNDPLPALAVGSASVAEGDADTTVLTFPVSLSTPSGRTVTVDWTTARRRGHRR